MADMDRRLRLTMLFDLYAPLMTAHRRELLRLYCEEDLSLSEIAAQMQITRQGVSDAIGKAERQLEEYETALGILQRSLDTARAARQGLDALAQRQDAAGARHALEEILRLQG